jgi:hypothetical protein
MPRPALPLPAEDECDRSLGLHVQRSLPLGSVLRQTMLHAHPAPPALLLEMTEHVPVVDLARAGFLPTRVVATLEVPDLVPTPIDVRDEIPLGGLLTVGS